MKPSTVFGVFKGMGDLICAAPVILSELQRDRSVHLLLFPSATLREFCGLIDFSPHREDLHLHVLPNSASPTQVHSFLEAMRHLRPETVWISPHAPARDSSWKIPLALRAIQLLFWSNARLVGADSEHLSGLLHTRLAVDRTLPLKQREWSAYRIFRGGGIPQAPPKIRFIPTIDNQRRLPPRFDLVIHPGANAKNRSWPFDKYAPLISALPRAWRIAMVGLPSDLEIIRKTMPPGRPVEYVTGTIAESIRTLASASLLFIMDSGNMHFAQVLEVPAVAVFGYTDPADIIDLNSYVDAIYEPRFPCQPCRKAVCSQPEIICLQAIEPQVVAERLIASWNRTLGGPTSTAILVPISNT
jgi:heptosyltransferase-2